jgi:hypothetical protein
MRAEPAANRRGFLISSNSKRCNPGENLAGA